MEQNKTSRYFKYAIGEIILVVIGILIALQVSNLNDQRKSALKTEALFDKFEDELTLTISNANFDISNSIIGDSLMKSVLKNKVSREDYFKNDRLEQLLYWRFTLNPETDNMDKIIEKEETLDEKYKDILFAINRFSFTRDREVDAMNVLRVAAEENSDFINLNYAWARQSDSLSNKEALNYYLNDETYKNRLFTHWKKAMDYNITITMYRVDVLKILSELKMIREGYSAPELKKLFNDLDQKPMLELGIDESIENLVSDDELVKSSLLVNLTKDTLFIKAKNRNGDLFGEGSINPREVGTTRPYLNDLYGDNLKIFEIYKDTVCIKKYKEVQYGYIILE